MSDHLPAALLLQQVVKGCCKVHDFCEKAYITDRDKCATKRSNIDLAFQYNKATKKCMSGYGTDDIEKAKCGYATCLCDMEMIRCFKHYKEDLDLDKYHEWERLQKKSCAFKARGDICFKDSCYTFAPRGNTWPENRKTCQDKGGDLVAMEEEEEWQFVNTEIQKRTIPKPMEYHIGLLKEERRAVW
ncbi:uncharacterized protein [Porites lutea]|uniref:uncharacterized protein n=1 Tax=Porites lutea TaxID=51062 RepID=UPI003CC666CC